MYTVSNVKFFRGHDGDGFNATLKFNGKAVATVDDDGWGGGYLYNWVSTEAEKSFKDMIASLPSYEYHGLIMPMSADVFVSNLIRAYSTSQQLKKWMKKAVVFKLKGDNDGEYRTVPVPKGRTMDSEFIRQATMQLQVKYGTQLEQIYNMGEFIKNMRGE